MATPENKAARLGDVLADADAQTVLRAALVEQIAGRTAVVTSFGAEAAPLLHLVSQVRPDAPVLFVDTGKHFGETKSYGRDLAARFGLTDVRYLTPVAEVVDAVDPDGVLFSTQPDVCCATRKVAPLQAALQNFDAWITGRKRYQAATRSDLAVVDADATHIKFNPIIDWSREDVQAYFDAHGLPRHPLEADGYLSIGCMTCTDRVRPGEDPRAGRWRGAAKVECGIHRIEDVQPKRQGGTHAVV
ncbi:MAG: phosphoadenylyl-sulfate reductase [Alphaproteobacteria bacterium]